MCAVCCVCIAFTFDRLHSTRTVARTLGGFYRLSVTLALNYECNHCHFWQTDVSADDGRASGSSENCKHAAGTANEHWRSAATHDARVDLRRATESGCVSLSWRCRCIRGDVVPSVTERAFSQERFC
jgi:hypothetical protein